MKSSTFSATLPLLSARAWEFDVVYIRASLNAVLATGGSAAVRKAIVAYCGYNYFRRRLSNWRNGLKAQKIFSASTKLNKSDETIVAWHRDLSRRLYDAPRPFFDCGPPLSRPQALGTTVPLVAIPVDRISKFVSRSTGLFWLFWAQKKGTFLVSTPKKGTRRQRVIDADQRNTKRFLALLLTHPQFPTADFFGALSKKLRSAPHHGGGNKSPVRPNGGRKKVRDRQKMAS